MSYLIYFAALIAFVSAMTMIYHRLPYRSVGVQKPMLTFMPKYGFDFDDCERLEERLLAKGFSMSGSRTRYRSGFRLGDFSTRLMRLVVDIDEPNKRATLKGGSWVILFDTGDLWKMARELRGQA